jgi:hypothetical protein
LTVVKNLTKQIKTKQIENQMLQKKRKTPTKSAKTFYLKYPQKFSETDTNKLKSYFKQASVEIKESNSFITIVKVVCKDKKCISMTNKQLRIANIAPIELQVNNRTEKKHNWMIPPQFIYNVTAKESLLDKGIGNPLKEFIEYPNEINANSFSCHLKQQIQEYNIVNASECLLLCVLFGCIKGLKIEILSVDSKIQEIILDQISEFRCDFAFIMGDTLVIMENKYHSNRMNEQVDAYTCILYRAYPQKVIEYLTLNNKNIPTNCLLIGIGFSIKDAQPAIKMQFSCSLSKDFARSDYKTQFFIDEMKTNKRHFKSLAYLNNIKY